MSNHRRGSSHHGVPQSPSAHVTNRGRASTNPFDVSPKDESPSPSQASTAKRRGAGGPPPPSPVSRTTNPFDDDDNSHGRSRASYSPSPNAARGRHGNNPFDASTGNNKGDDDDDNGNDGRRRIGTNPFSGPSTTTSSSSPRANRKTSLETSYTNPFDEPNQNVPAPRKLDHGGGGGGTVMPLSARPPKQMTGGGSPVDPFETASSGKTTTTTASTNEGTGTNPFDFDADFNGGSGRPPPQAAGRVISIFSGLRGRGGGNVLRDDADGGTEPIITGIDGAGSDERKGGRGPSPAPSSRSGGGGGGANKHRRHASDLPPHVLDRGVTAGVSGGAGTGGGSGGGSVRPKPMQERSRTSAYVATSTTAGSGGPSTMSSDEEMGSGAGSSTIGGGVALRSSIMAGNLANWLRGNKAADEDELTPSGHATSGGGSGGGTSNNAVMLETFTKSSSDNVPQDDSKGGGVRSRINPLARSGITVGGIGTFGQSSLEKKKKKKMNESEMKKKKKKGLMSDSPTRDAGKKKKMKNQKKLTVAGGRIKIQRWPYDDYHTAQVEYYQSLEANGFSDGGMGGLHGGGSSDQDDDVAIKGSGYRSSDDGERGGAGRRSSATADDGTGTGAGSSKFIERPPELPSIKEAVQGLSLADFERKAEERAIGIVSMWLFDAGLIDELLVNGAPVRYRSLWGAGGGGDGASVADRSASSVKTSEGVEVGAHGFPLGVDGGALKVDREIEKLRVGMQRELSVVNARLNDGVAASGTEVQELVNAVAATKGDLGRLRELTTYISDGTQGTNANSNSSGAGNARDELLLARYPRLRGTVNARRNLYRCFRELEFFSQIPSTCDRLREELHSGEWTTNEWSTIRSVSMEHVELEILLVEAEAGMKARIDGEDGLGGHNSSYLGSPGNYEAVDRFLSAHVKNVWELGDEIRMRILSGIGSSFDLALNNPAGMVALVEAVEVYERAAEQYKALYEDRDDRASSKSASKKKKERQKLRFTDMRAAALAQIYQDFELRGLEVFRAIHMQAADVAEEEDALNSQFNGVLRAATELVAEIDLVKNEISPCFPPHWAVEVLWSSCVAHVCSNQILQQIGGPDGHNLTDLTVTQLLDLVAWVEFFRETIEESFPNLASINTSKKTYFDSRPDLFAGNKKEVDMERATDSLAWVNNMLWEVHRLAQEEFLVRTRVQTNEWLDNVYAAEHEKNQSQDGRLTTSLCEDVFSLASVQLRTIRERLTRKSEALIMAVCLIFSHLRSKQIHSRDNFLQDLETCCAAANDFIRMSEKCEDVMSELLRECEFSEDSVSTLEASSSELLALYSSDAVFAAQSVHPYIFEPIREAIADKLFSREWEEDLTHNDLALTLVRTLEDFMSDLEQYLDELMVRKAVDALVSATVIFYIKCLLVKAENHSSVKVSCFNDNDKALERMTGDIRVMRDYFEGLEIPSLGRHIEKEFEILTAIHECMCIAAGYSESDASDFILVLQKRIRNIDITKHLVGDLWHLVSPTQERTVWELVESMEQELTAIAPTDDAAAFEARQRSSVPGLRLDEMMAKLYIDSKRKRPVKASALEKMVATWKKNWTTEEAAPEGSRAHEN